MNSFKFFYQSITTQSRKGLGGVTGRQIDKPENQITGVNEMKQNKKVVVAKGSKNVPAVVPQVGQAVKIGGKTLVAKSAHAGTSVPQGKALDLINTLNKKRVEVADAKGKGIAAKTIIAPKAPVKVVAPIETVWEKEKDNQYYAVITDLLLYNLATPTGFIAFDPSIVVNDNGGNLASKITKNIDLRTWKKDVDEDGSPVLKGTQGKGKNAITLIVLY